jgi:hypothetical protein
MKLAIADGLSFKEATSKSASCTMITATVESLISFARL